MKSHIQIGLIGFGVVGSGTMQLLKQHQAGVEQRVGAKVSVKWVCANHRKTSPFLNRSIKQTRNWQDVVNDPEVDCIVELIGGLSPAKELVLAALQNGKHVVTANKAILSTYWDEIFGTADEFRKLVYFEAAVGGGVPVIQALNEGLAGNEIEKIIGILNGTTNYILTKMQEEGLSYQAALKQAQELGFAEADPTFDVEGIDAAQKISILASLAAGSWISPKQISIEGISQLKRTDIKLIQEKLNKTIKLLGIAEKSPSGWVLRVHPTLISKSHPFANVRNENNAILLQGNAAGEVMLYGKGAGKLPTSSAVLSDIIFLCRQIANGTAGQLPYVTKGPEIQTVSDMSALKGQYYLRITTKDKPGVLAKITGILGQFHVSIASVHQDSFERVRSRGGIPIILLTHENSESDVQQAVKAIDRLAVTTDKTVLLRMQ